MAPFCNVDRNVRWGFYDTPDLELDFGEDWLLTLSLTSSENNIDEHTILKRRQSVTTTSKGTVPGSGSWVREANENQD